MKKEIPSEEKLIELLLFIRHKEVKKPFDEMDHDLITACTELLLDLQNIEVTLSPEEINEKVKNIPFIESIDTKAVKSKRKINKKRILLIAAIISVLIAILSIASIGSEWNMFDILIDKFGRVSGAPSGVEFYENGVSYGVNGPEKFYSSIDDFMKNENPDILLPSDFPNALTLKDIAVSTEGEHDIINLLFEEGLSYTVYKKTPIPEGVIENVSPVTMGNTGIYIEDLSDVNSYQVHFSYNGDYYYIVHSDKQQVLEILKNLEVYL
ncbi:MAG: hypothetical protein J6D06_04325 [Clostridia bacterium]|nr:hypothetical protein [Clostridia bacterium]